MSALMMRLAREVVPNHDPREQRDPRHNNSMMCGEENAIPTVSSRAERASGARDRGPEGGNRWTALHNQGGDGQRHHDRQIELSETEARAKPPSAWEETQTNRARGAADRQHQPHFAKRVPAALRSS